MLTILRGPERSLWQHCCALHSSSEQSLLLPPARVPGPEGFVRHNANLRDLLAKTRRLVGDEKFEKTVLQHKVAASLLLDHLEGLLSAEEQAEAARLSTSLDSQTSHNWFTSRFLVVAWVRLFADLISDVNVTWIMPDFQDMGANFIEMVRRLLIDQRPEKLTLVMGFKSERLRLLPDERGIVWNYPQVRNLRDSFSVFEDAQIVQLEDEATEVDLPAAIAQYPLETDVWDTDRDSRLFSAVAADECSSSDLQECVDTLGRIFSVYDFRAALQLGLQSLRHESAMTTRQRAFVNAAVGISAHNRQFSALRTNENFSLFLERHLERALFIETDVLRRSVISYRLATTLGRRAKRADAAIACVDRSLRELFEMVVPSRRRAYCEAWLLNIRAYAHMLLRNYRQSEEDVEASFKLAEEFWNHAADPTPDEIYSAQLFAGNRATLAMYGGNDEQLDEWFSKGTGLFEKHWGLGRRYVRYLRLQLSRRKLDLATAITAGEEGLADAIAERSAEYQDLYRMNVADAYYRLGDLEPVFKLLRESLRMYEKIGEKRRRFVALMFLAEAHSRSGNLAAADGLYCWALESGSTLSKGALADLSSARGLLAARKNLPEEASNLMDEAIEFAVEWGDRDILLLVARRSGDALLQFGDKEQAADAYRRALEIAGTTSAEVAREPFPSDLAMSYIGLYECEERSEHLEAALREVPGALELDAAFWWEIPRILRHLLRSADEANLLERNLPEIELLLRAAGQRNDAHELAARLLKKLDSRPSPAGDLIISPPMELERTHVRTV